MPAADVRSIVGAAPNAPIVLGIIPMCDGLTVLDPTAPIWLTMKEALKDKVAEMSRGACRKPPAQPFKRRYRAAANPWLIGSGSGVKKHQE
jgi:hypothetical protein